MRARKIISVYFSGFLVGIALVLFPAAGTIFTDSTFHDFTSAQYGSIFIPQIIFAIISSLSAPKIAEKVGMKKVMIYGLIAILISMFLLTASNWLLKEDLDYWIILTATAFIGTGFGFTITALNPFAYILFPGKETSAVTAMHILLGLGTASSALLLNVFLNNGIWWGAPALVSVVSLLLILFMIPVPLTFPETEKTIDKVEGKTPRRIWLFAVVVFLYGACEATLGNFGAVFLEKEGGLSIGKASIGLSLFWGGITLGRLLFTFIALKYSTKIIYVMAPFLVAVIFYTMPYAKGEVMLLANMAFAGLGLSFLFPKSISASTGEFPKQAALISGVMVASIQLGTGFSSYIIGLFNNHYALSLLFQISTFYALTLGILITYLMFTKKKPNQFINQNRTI